ncbi:FkbH domain-containing protein [Burkholderia pseudomallei]|uniref:FkbH domain-containing protein n=1 Tax=Burkholderia pseudomallei TaxID=28450 RepID=UPI0005388034|nr:FkbH domain-containing protein [Burkholderia pseudomallei]KGW45173.1 putative fkbH domain protein [Burkholderia pseudomallei MSHR684]OMW23465.1 FkbH domain-containing protein [Burkholderia pseudomallei]
MSARRLYVGATFTASPLDPLLRARGFGDVAFARYNQLLQALVAPDPRHADDATLLLVRLADFVRHEANDRTQSPDALAALLAQRADAWLDALASFAAGRARPPCIVVLPSPALDARGAAPADTGRRLERALLGVPGLRALDWADFAASSAIAQPFDPIADKLGHVPLSIEGFAAFAQWLAERLRGEAGEAAHAGKHGGDAAPAGANANPSARAEADAARSPAGAHANVDPHAAADIAAATGRAAAAARAAVPAHARAPADAPAPAASPAAPSPSLARFFERLQLRIAGVALDDETALAKSARLSHTAATFHLSGRPYLEADLLDATSRDAAALALTAADRFGQYGCSGFVLVRADAGLPVLAEFVLSCTVLGKQVEHGVLLALAQAAQRAALPAVALDYVRTDGNQPAVDFVDAIAAQAGVALDRSGPRARLRIAPCALAEAVLACAKAPQALAAAAQALDLAPLFSHSNATAHLAAHR